MTNCFVIIGAQRSGTTFLYHLLSSHHDICMARPIRPEPKFFLEASNLEKGRQYYEQKYFFDFNRIWLGEKSTSYIEYPEVKKRVLSFYPKAKFIAVLRNPVYRAISNYRFSLESGLETRTIEEVFLEKKPPPPKPEGISVSPFDYLDRGNYHGQIERWMHGLSKCRVKVLIQERLVANPTSGVNELVDFLGLKSPFNIPHGMGKINASKEYMIPDSVVRELGLYYKNSISELEDLLGVEISEWK